MVYILALVYESNSLSALQPLNNHSTDLLSNVLRNPNVFVKEAAKLDPQVLKQVLGLLEGLLTVSNDAEKKLSDTLSEKKRAAQLSEAAVATAVSNRDTAKTALDSANTLLVTKEGELTTAKDTDKIKQREKEAAQKEWDDSSSDSDNEQKVLRDVIALLQDLLPDRCVGGSELHGTAQEGKVIACKGSFTGHPKDAGFCGTGWHTCNGEDVHVTYKVTKPQSTSFSGCYVYDSMNDCNGCWKHCENNATPVKQGGCLDRDAGHDLAGMGKNCNVHGSSACLVDARSNVVGYNRNGCSVNGAPADGGVMCCKD